MKVQDAHLTRRRMLANATRAVAGLTLTASCAHFGEFPWTKPPRGFKLAVCDWTVGKRTDPASFEIARRIGVDGVQVDFGSGQKQLPLFNPELQKKFLEQAKKHNMEIASLALGVLNNVPYQDDTRAEKWVAQSIDVCKAMNLSVVLVPFFGKADLRNNPRGIDNVVQRFKKVAAQAEMNGVCLGIESWLSAEQHLEIIERIGSPAIKVYYDVGNSHKAGYDIYKEIRQLGKHICEFHAKDYDDLYGKGTIAFKEVRRAMDDIGYRGWIVMEGVKMPLGVEESCRYDAQYLRTIFPSKL